MPLGPGIYDDLCTHVREQTNAKAAIVIIIGGNAGTGFSVQSQGNPIDTRLPDILETMAREIRASMKAKNGN